MGPPLVAPPGAPPPPPVMAGALDWAVVEAVVGAAVRRLATPFVGGPRRRRGEGGPNDGEAGERGLERSAIGHVAIITHAPQEGLNRHVGRLEVLAGRARSRTSDAGR